MKSVFRSFYQCASYLTTLVSHSTGTSHTHARAHTHTHTVICDGVHIYRTLCIQAAFRLKSYQQTCAKLVTTREVTPPPHHTRTHTRTHMHAQGLPLFSLNDLRLGNMPGPSYGSPSALQNTHFLTIHTRTHARTLAHKHQPVTHGAAPT